jgi:hypothetical protein
LLFFHNHQIRPIRQGTGGFQITGLKKRVDEWRNSSAAAKHNQETQQEQDNDYRRQPILLSFFHEKPDVF